MAEVEHTDAELTRLLYLYNGWTGLVELGGAVPRLIAEIRRLRLERDEAQRMANVRLEKLVRDLLAWASNWPERGEVVTIIRNHERQVK